MNIKLQYKNGRVTGMYIRLQRAADPEGTTPERRKGGWTDHQDYEHLVTAGLVERRHSGPRGGRRYHATERGLEALREVTT